MKVDLGLGLTPMIMAKAEEYGLLRNQLAYCLATGYHETARTMLPVSEAYYLGNKAEAYRKRLRYYPWYGRGLVQLTWKDNYATADLELGLGGKLLDDPEYALDDNVSVSVLLLGMLHGWFTGGTHKLADHITLQKSDFYNARRIVNGTDRAADIADIAEAYDAALRAVGYGEAKQVDRLTLLEARVAELEEWRNSAPISSLT